MTVGLPGTGIGGLFYLTLVAAMPICELYRTARGRSSRARWRMVGLHTSLAGAIILCLLLEAWLIVGVLNLFSTQGESVATSVADTQSVVPGLAWMSLAVLGLVLLSVQLLRLGLRLQARRQRALAETDRRGLAGMAPEG